MGKKEKASSHRSEFINGFFLSFSHLLVLLFYCAVNKQATHNSSQRLTECLAACLISGAIDICRRLGGLAITMELFLCRCSCVSHYMSNAVILKRVCIHTSNIISAAGAWDHPHLFNHQLILVTHTLVGKKNWVTRYYFYLGIFIASVRYNRLIPHFTHWELHLQVIHMKEVPPSPLNQLYFESFWIPNKPENLKKHLITLSGCMRQQPRLSHAETRSVCECQSLTPRALMIDVWLNAGPVAPITNLSSSSSDLYFIRR